MLLIMLKCLGKGEENNVYDEMTKDDSSHLPVDITDYCQSEFIQKKANRLLSRTGSYKYYIFITPTLNML